MKIVFVLLAVVLVMTMIAAFLGIGRCKDVRGPYTMTHHGRIGTCYD